MKNNIAHVIGTVVGTVGMNHRTMKENFYRFTVQVNRLSGIQDLVPCMVSDKLCDISQIKEGVVVDVVGQFRSFNWHEKEKIRLILYVLAEDIQIYSDNYGEEDASDILLDGWLCKTPIYRETPSGRKITDLLLAVNRPVGQTDYIPCICWGRNALFAAGLNVGSKIKIDGRIQSRKYNKVIDGIAHTLTAYEVSASGITRESGKMIYG